jgi:hypothetical protein
MDLKVELSGNAYLHELMVFEKPRRYSAVLSVSVRHMGDFGCGERAHSFYPLIVPITEKQYLQLKQLKDNKRIGIAIGRLEISLR